jgi:hypothetical protein
LGKKSEKRRRLVAVLDTSKARWPEGPKARVARLSQWWEAQEEKKLTIDDI